MLAKVRSMESHENMPRQQLEKIFTIPSTHKPTAKPASQPKKPTISFQNLKTYTHLK